jgi:hypothetical protein
MRLRQLGHAAELDASGPARLRLSHPAPNQTLLGQRQMCVDFLGELAIVCIATNQGAEASS